MVLIKVAQQTAIIAYQTAFKNIFRTNSLQPQCQWNFQTKKLSEFYEELKRLNINIIRPDINNVMLIFPLTVKIFFTIRSNQKCWLRGNFKNY